MKKPIGFIRLMKVNCLAKLNSLNRIHQSTIKGKVVATITLGQLHKR